MTNITVFNYTHYDERCEHPSSVRTLAINGEVYFLAYDVASVLNYSKTQNIMKVVDDDEYIKHELTFTAPNGGAYTKEVTWLNESGLYHVIIKSTKLEAVRFRRWVTKEVLPTLRKTGKFMMDASSVTHVSYLDEQQVLLAERYALALERALSAAQQLNELRS